MKSETMTCVCVCVCFADLKPANVLLRPDPSCAMLVVAKLSVRAHTDH